jgi:hypothetical protein
VGIDAFDAGFVVGILIGEGHFGGDGRQPHITVRMHVRHEALFHRLVALFPRSKLYGPYHHAARAYFQWMARGACLKEDLAPLLERHLTAELDGYAHARYRAMKARYAF